MKKLDFIRKVLMRSEFVPKYRNNHYQTIYGVTKTRDKRSLPSVNVRYLTLKDRDKIKLDCYWQKNAKKALNVIIVHGMVGSSKTEYVLGTAAKAYNRGYNIIAVNLRNCGESENLSRKLYHAGQSNDIKEVVKWLIKKKLGKIGVVCFSLSGNIVLKMAGEWGRKYPRKVFGIAAVSPLVDLHAGWRLIDKKENRFYRFNFLSSLRKMIKRKAMFFPEYDFSLFQKVKTIRDFDEVFHTRYSGFKSADDYYTKASARFSLKKIFLPCLILHADDDTLVPIAPLKDRNVKGRKNIILILTKYGGHAGFISKKSLSEDEFWAENRVLEFFDLLQA